MADTAQQKLKLDDMTIAHIVKLIQLGLITGTDIVDHMRMIELIVDDNGVLHVEPEYDQRQTDNIERMLKEAEQAQQETQATPEG